MLLESPAVLVDSSLFLIASPKTVAHWCFFSLWNLHDVYRSSVLLCLIRSGQRVPLTIAMSGAGFHVVNGWLQAAWLFHHATPTDHAWLRSPAFLTGTLLFQRFSSKCSAPLCFCELSVPAPFTAVTRMSFCDGKGGLPVSMEMHRKKESRFR